jgi:methylmalonyl-CoA mutase cobalamin-binding subunit/DNA-binding transcriptional MerR regulator
VKDPKEQSELASSTLDSLPIAAVERDTGLSKDTLRVWERRYGFPQPVRDTFDERVYPADQVERLRLIARLLSSGQRPGRVVPLPLAELQQIAQDYAPQAHADQLPSADQQQVLALLKQHDVAALRRALSQATLRLGLGRFVTDLLAPLNVMVGEAWMRGEIQVFEEHMYTESVTAVLRGAIGSAPVPPMAGRPRVLLATFPQEAHALGLLMAEAMLVLEGCECISLGVQTPVLEIAQAAQANRAQVVGLSFSASGNANQLLRGLQELRTKLPPEVAIWAGGSHPALRRRELAGITPVPSLADIPTLVAQWATEH